MLTADSCSLFAHLILRCPRFKLSRQLAGSGVQRQYGPHRAVTRNAQDALLPTLTVAVSFFARWAAETRGRACALTAIVIAAIGFLGRPAPLCLFIGDLQTTLLPQLTPTGGVFSVFPSLVTKGYIVLPCHSRGVFALR